ncbi:MAG TPA: GntR family transcriptional regulator [Trueperaceae bacterium]|nr:GntR family transcriptional regulator [Trueperaceae bacterium]
MARPTKKDLAYDFIKRRILEKRLLPGQRITASQIAEEIGTSVLPVREALLSLEAERLVTITPYVGAVVAWVSADEVYEVINMLAVLEGYATAQALPRARSLAKGLLAINARLRAAVQQEMWSWFIELNREFHFTIFEAADNGVLLENIRIFWSQLDTMLAATSFHLVPNRAQEDVDEHVELVALLSGDSPDPLAIELAARRHRLRTATYLHRQSQPVAASTR